MSASAPSSSNTKRVSTSDTKHAVSRGSGSKVCSAPPVKTSKLLSTPANSALYAHAQVAEKQAIETMLGDTHLSQEMLEQLVGNVFI